MHWQIFFVHWLTLVPAILFDCSVDKTETKNNKLRTFLGSFYFGRCVTTHHFGGPDRAVGQLCVCLRAIILNYMTFDLDSRLPIHLLDPI